MNPTTIQQKFFGKLPTGEVIDQYILSNSTGMTVKLINYGASITSIKSPDNLELTLGFDTLEEYLKHEFYFGCTIGRVANRIKQGKFSLDGKTFQLALNNNAHHLHGGTKGYDKVVWQTEVFQERNLLGVSFSYFSSDGEEGYPGNVMLTTTYILTPKNELKIIYYAKTDAATPFNLTNHTYWNLAGAGSGDILNHELYINADEYLETDEEHIPNGQLKSVDNTIYDFRFNKKIISKIDKMKGYDICYRLHSGTSQPAARVRNPNNKNTLEIYTTQPGMQFYTGNYLYSYPIAENKTIDRWSGFCFETQGFPDALNHPHFPSIILLPEHIYHHETIYKFHF